MSLRWVFVWLALVPWVGAFPVEIVDGRGDAILVAEKPARVVSLAPSCTETVFALGAGDRLVGRTPWCAFPPAADKVGVVAGFDEPNAEQLLRLEPDVIFAADITRAATVAYLRRLGFSVVVLAAEGLEGVRADIRATGAVLGKRQEAEALIAEMKATEADVEADPVRLAGRPPRALLAYEAGENYAAGSGTFAHAFLTLSGAENIAARAASPWPRLTDEFLLEADPEVILLTADEGPFPRQAGRELLRKMERDPAWRHLAAVRAQRVWLVDRNLLNIPGPRTHEALRQVHNALRQASAEKP